MRGILKLIIFCVLLTACNFTVPEEEISYLIEYRLKDLETASSQKYLQDYCEKDVFFYKSTPVKDQDGDSIFVPLTLHTILNVCDSTQLFTWVVLLDKDYERLSYKWTSDTSVSLRIFNPTMEQELNLVWTFDEDGRNQMISY